LDGIGKVLLQLFYKRKLRIGIKTYLEQIFSLFIIKLKKLGFSAPLRTASLNSKFTGSCLKKCTFTCIARLQTSIMTITALQIVAGLHQHGCTRDLGFHFHNHNDPVVGLTPTFVAHVVSCIRCFTTITGISLLSGFEQAAY